MRLYLSPPVKHIARHIDNNFISPLYLKHQLHKYGPKLNPLNSIAKYSRNQLIRNRVMIFIAYSKWITIDRGRTLIQFTFIVCYLLGIYMAILNVLSCLEMEFLCCQETKLLFCIIMNLSFTIPISWNRYDPKWLLSFQIVPLKLNIFIDFNVFDTQLLWKEISNSRNFA